MDLAIISDAGVVILAIGGLVPYLIPEIEEPVRKSLRLRVAMLFLFAGLGGAVVVCNRLERNKADQKNQDLQTQLNSMPQRVAEYIKNISPPIASLPSAPLIAKPRLKPSEAEMLLRLGKHSQELSAQIFAFLQTQGQAPVNQEQGEQWSDYINRSNAWYRKVMTEYDRQFGADVLNTVQQLIKEGLVDKNLEDYAKYPTNPLGIRELALTLGATGVKLTRK